MSKKRLSIIILLVLVFALFASSIIAQESFLVFTGQLDAYAQAHPFIGVLVFVSLAAVSALLSPFSSIPLVPSAVVVWGAEKTFGLLYLGWFLGGIISYGIGYYLGYPVVEKIVSKKSVDKWIKILSERVDISIALLFRMTTPSETGYVFGALKYNFLKYLCVTLLAELPVVYIIVYAGAAFIDVGWVSLIGLSFIWLLIISLAIYSLNKRLKK